MKFGFDEAEKAARFVHERTRELAPQGAYQDFPSWEDLPEDVKAIIIQVVKELIAQLMIGYDAPPKHGLN